MKLKENGLKAQTKLGQRPDMNINSVRLGLAGSPAAADSSPPSSPETTENRLQPFFVLHEASSRKPERTSTGTVKTRKKIDFSPSKLKNVEKPDVEIAKEGGDEGYGNLRMDAFEVVWSKIESTIKDVLRDINANVFNEIHQWVRDSFSTIRSFGMLTFREATQAFPIVTDASSKQLFTGLVLTKNMEFVDDLLTFEELGRHLKSQGCHVANLSSLDFTAKSGIGGCLRSLLRQFLVAPLDAADISILASWYREQGNYNNPVVVIVDDIERCCGSVLSDFILMFSEWVLKIPVILIMGVTTTLDAPRNILPSNVLQRLCPCMFTLGTPSERMDAIIEAVLVRQCSGFSISHKVAVFMRNYFVRQDGTITSFIRALKIACSQHFSMEPLSIILKGFFLEEDRQGLQDGLLLQAMFKHAFDLPSYGRNKMGEENVGSFAHCLSELKRSQTEWRTVVLVRLQSFNLLYMPIFRAFMFYLVFLSLFVQVLYIDSSFDELVVYARTVSCLYEAGKGDRIQLLDLLCEALNPALYSSRTSGTFTKVDKGHGVSPSNNFPVQQHPIMRKGRLICQAVQKVRDLPIAQLYKLLKRWEELTVDINEIHAKLKELLSVIKLENGRSSRQDMADSSKRPVSRSQLNIEKESRAVNEKAASLIECMVRDYMQPVECSPLHEIVCFKNVETLQLALIGDPRRRIQIDLLESYKILRCSCCSRSGHSLLPSLHDTSILARFCKAVTELQITGLIRMPTKRRPDFVQRVAFDPVVFNNLLLAAMSLCVREVTANGETKDNKPFKIFVGYDPREDLAYRVCHHSILKRSSIPVKITPIVQSDLRKSGLYWRERGQTESTEFSFSRFLTPYLAGFDGWAVFVDCDFLYLADIKELCDLIDDKYAIMCVHHDYTPKETTKMDGAVQTVYPRKNWSSMVLYNCGHPKNKILTPEVVNTQTGAFLHRFQWLEDEEIGSIPFVWNFLEGHNRVVENDPTTFPKAIHYTRGGPWFEAWKHCEFADLWLKEMEEYKNESNKTVEK
ncbi:Origin of replication complex subunit 3 [Citrus sinensis]|uniref:Origin of replication complex subunit 3 n=1 Tax=Citrus sinensis TaxID=2711 RepID=A0ACB8LCZ5_CITSI|nr:Origin of replication complex subunit 3 [Citrus sinensis]